MLFSEKERNTSAINNVITASRNVYVGIFLIFYPNLQPEEKKKKNYIYETAICDVIKFIIKDNCGKVPWLTYMLNYTKGTTFLFPRYEL